MNDAVKEALVKQEPSSRKITAGGGEHHVVIVGGGFGGLYAAKALRKAPVRVTLLDRHNHHTFQPLLYQVATGGLNPSDIASPIRRVLRDQKNARVLLADVTGIDAEAKEVVGGWAIMQYDTIEEAVADQQEFAELHAKYWPEVTVISTLRQISTGPEAPGA